MNLRPTVLRRATTLATRVVVLIVALVVGLAGCGDTADLDQGTPSSGLRGRAMVDIGCPVVTVGDPCPSRPVSAEIVVTAPGADEPWGTVVSDADGRFEMRLPPGTYAVPGRAADGGPLPFAKSVEVTVVDGELTWLRVSFDSGIR